MQDPDLVDRLAEWCRLSERGWRRDPESGVLCEPEWVRDVPGGVKVWRPLDSDDDCRVVLERFYEATNWYQHSMLYDKLATAMYAGEERCWNKWLLLASPREKCQAVLKVLGDA